MRAEIPTSVNDPALLLSPGLCEIRLEWGYAPVRHTPSYEDWCKEYSINDREFDEVKAIVPFIVFPVSGKRILSDEGASELIRMSERKA